MSSRDENSQNNILKYDAFISYRHSELDKYVAVSLHKKLENFKLPKSVLSKVKGDKTKITRVFRDEAELQLSDNLSEPIDQALFNSEFLIVICTPRLSQSRWCLREIETFLKTHDRKHILLVLAEGEPDESFPKILRYEDVEVTDEAGNTHIERRTLEPLAADARGNNKKEIKQAIDDAVLKLVAAMFGLNYDDLKQRHREQRLRKMFAIWSAVTAFVLIFALVCLGLFAVILKQRNDIKDRYAGTVADAAQGLLESGRREEAIYALRSVLDVSEPYNVDAYRQMTKALDLYALGEEYIPLRYFSVPSIIVEYKLSNNANYIIIGGLNGDYHIFDVNENKIVYSFKSTQNTRAYSNFGFDGEVGIFYISDDDDLIYASLIDNNEKKLYDANATIISDASCDITSILLTNKFVGYKNGELVYETDLRPYAFGFEGAGCIGYSYSPDGNHVLLSVVEGEDSWLLQFNTVTGKLEYSLQTNIYLLSSYATDGRRIYIVRNNSFDKNMPVDSSLGIIDIYNPYAVKTVTIPLVYTNDIVICDEGICITTYNDAIMLDKNDYNLMYKTEGLSDIVSVFRYKTGIGIVDSIGSFHIFGDDYFDGADVTANLFGIVPRGSVNQVIFQNDKFYYCFSDNYVVEYVDNPRAVKETEEYRKFNYHDELCFGANAEEALMNINDIDGLYVYSSVYSNDKKHIAISMCDKSLRIYNADTYKLEKVEYDLDNAVVLSFVYIEEADIYILTVGSYSYILDSEFNYVSDIDYCVGFEDGSFIVYYQREYYRLKMLSFEEILKLADDELEGYVPDEAVMNKYIVKYNN